MKDGKRKRGGFGAFPGRDPARDQAPVPMPPRPIAQSQVAVEIVTAQPRASTRADKTNVIPFPERPMNRVPMSLDKMYTRFDALAEGRDGADRGWNLHAAIIDRLAANMREAEDRGWTACALERAGGMGRLRAFGINPGDPQRRVIPDWRFEPQS
jgi:hypothetical protein